MQLLTSRGSLAAEMETRVHEPQGFGLGVLCWSTVRVMFRYRHSLLSLTQNT